MLKKGGENNIKKKKVFTGVHFTPKAKCVNCKRFEECCAKDNVLTTELILLDCESFYYVFKCLEEVEKRPVLDGNLKKQHEGIPYLTQPCIVNGALAVELALKFLTFKENESFECIHNLQKLFEKLPDCHKKILIERICREAHQDEVTLTIKLSDIANLFEDFRYSFGKESLGFSNFFFEFVHIVCDYALSQKTIYEDNVG